MIRKNVINLVLNKGEAGIMTTSIPLRERFVVRSNIKKINKTYDMSGIVVSVLFLEHFNKDKRSYKNFGQVLRKTCV